MKPKDISLKQKKIIAREGLMILGSLLAACLLSIFWFNSVLKYNLAFGFTVFFYTILVLTLFIYASAKFTIWAIQTLKEKG